MEVRPLHERPGLQVKSLSGFLAYCAECLVSRQDPEEGDVPSLRMKELLGTQSQARGHTLSCGTGI